MDHAVRGDMAQDRLHRPDGGGLIALVQQAGPDAPEDAVGEAAGGAGFVITGGIVDQGVPHAVFALMLQQALRLGLQGGLQEGMGLRGDLHHLQEFRDGDGDPAVAPAPEGTGKIMAAVEGPAVVPQARLRVGQVLGMEPELIFRLPDVFGLPFDPAHIGQEQHGHKEGIVPQLLIVQGVGGHVLEAALLRSGELLHDPACGLPAGGQIPLGA